MLKIKELLGIKNEDIKDNEEFKFIGEPLQELRDNDDDFLSDCVGVVDYLYNSTPSRV